jgi:hypothetical protein
MITFVLIFRIIICSIALFFIIDRLVKLVRRNVYQSLLKVATVFFVWGVIFFVAAFPQSIQSVFKTLGITQPFENLSFLAFIVVFAILYKIINILERIEKNITEIVRVESLRELKRKKPLNSRKR